MTDAGEQVDVIVVGYGVAGAAAALTAADAGARVLVLEATAAGGGNCRHSGGFLFDVPGDRLVEHLDALCFGRTPRAVLEAYATGIQALAAWLDGIGVPTDVFDPPPGRVPASFPAWPSFPAGHDIRYRVAAGGDGSRGEALWRGIAGAVAARDVEVRCETRVRRLLTDAAGSVTGVVCEGEQRILAAGGVVLACGGFEAEPELADAYLQLGPAWAVGHQANRGDGLVMAQAVGAALWHMYAFFGWFAFRAPGHTAPFALDLFAPGFLYVDADGRRFCDETGHEVHDRLRALTTYLPHRPNRPRLPAWIVFDEATREAGALNGMLGTPNDYAWSADNSAEVERGWIARSDTPAALATVTGLPEDTLTATLAAYAEATRSGRDELFHRDPETLVALRAPLYAIKVWPGVAGTVGGPRHDATARVLRRGGAAIDGLFAAGAVSLVWGHLIEFGGGLTDALVFGRTAGAGAAARARAATAAVS